MHDINAIAKAASALHGGDVTSMNEATGLLLHSLAWNRRPRRILEIGRFRGVSTLWLATALEAGGEIHSVDPQPVADGSLLSLLQPLRPDIKISLIVGFSPSQLPDGPFDLIYIDGDHNEQPVLDDLKGTLARLAPDGALVLHDVLNHEQAGVQAAMWLFAEENWLEVNLLRTHPEPEHHNIPQECPGLAVLVRSTRTRGG